MEPLTATINGFQVPATRNATNLNNPDKTPTTPPAIPTSQTSQVITPASLKSEPQIVLPEAPVSTVAPTFTNEADRILQQSQVEDTQAQQLGNKLSENIFNTLQNLTGEKQALAQEQNIAGVGKFRQQLQDINSQILKKQAELQQDDVRLIQSVQNLEQQKIPMEFITGQQQSVQRDAQIARALKASEIGILNASALATQGNIALAMETAQQAVDLKYAPYKEEIALYKSQLEALAPILSRDEKKQAREQELKANLALKDLETRQANDKAIQDMIINASAQNAPLDMLNRAKNAKTSSEAAMILGQYAGDYYKTELLKQQIATEKAQRSKIYSDISIAQAKSDGTNIAGKPLKVSNAEITNLNEALTARDSVNSLVNKFKENISTYGTQTLFGKASGERDALRTNLLLAIKNMEKTGALDAGTINVLEGSIPSSKFFATEAAQQAALDTLLSTVESKVTSYINSYKGTSAESDPRTKRAFLSEEVPPGTPNPFSAALGTPSTPIPGTSIINKVEDDGSIVFKIPTTTPITK